jgi:polysaccharide export outer membrane protein
MSIIAIEWDLCSPLADTILAADRFDRKRPIRICGIRIEIRPAQDSSRATFSQGATVKSNLGRFLAYFAASLTILTLGGGCRALNPSPAYTAPVNGPDATAGVPRELRKTILPPYVIEPPDLLTIEAMHMVPKQPYHLHPFDNVSIQVEGAPAEAPISGVGPIGADGTVVLGRYGTVYIANKTVEEAKEIITKHLATRIKDYDVSVTLADSSARQRISGPHLVAMDGTVTLGIYGSVSVVGLTVDQARQTLEQHLLQFFDSLELSVEVGGYNSKVYYIVTQGAGYGDGVYRFPMTGNETVLDALSQINGLRPVSSTKVWIARPTDDPACAQRLEVCWEDITSNAYARTNYQVLPGDRIFVAEDHLIAANTFLGKLFAPMEQVMGFATFGVGTVTRFSGKVLAGGGNSNAAF